MCGGGENPGLDWPILFISVEVEDRLRIKRVDQPVQIFVRHSRTCYGQIYHILREYAVAFVRALLMEIY